ncbi:MAG: LysR family transcriptional regulator [Lachnospiraceae bacterium]|nr:LysR family transcriptional regulator [Lachnospiraceae bacterium]
MDIRVLQYFLIVAREQSITKAAEVLHMTQPPLSRQLRDLEEELGKQLLIRGNRKVTLTEEGMILRKRAEEMVELMEKTKAEVTASNQYINGDIHIGGGETEGFQIISAVAQKVRLKHPGIRYHLFSGNADDVSERIDRGLLDFGILIEPADIRKYDFIRLPAKNRWGLLMRRDYPLALKKYIGPDDICGIPLIASRQSIAHNELSGWLGKQYESLDIVATYNLLYNASLMVRENVGCALCLEGIIPEYERSALVFRPLEPKIEVGLNIVWKKYQVFTKASELFLNQLNQYIQGVSDEFTGENES